MESLFGILKKIRLLKFEEDCLKTAVDRFLKKMSFLAFLVCIIHKEPIELSNFDPLYLIIHLEFQKAIKSNC